MANSLLSSLSNYYYSGYDYDWIYYGTMYIGYPSLSGFKSSLSLSLSDDELWDLLYSPSPIYLYRKCNALSSNV